MRDNDGTLRGVISLVNKLNHQKITDSDLYELSAILPSLGEIFRRADEIK